MKKQQAARQPGVVPGPSDLAILKLLYAYRLLRREHLSALTGRPAKRLHRRLLQLVQARYLARLPLRQQKHIYALGKAAAPLLVGEGIAEPELLLERSRIHELKELFLQHEMMVVDLHVVLELASQSNHLRLVSWKEGRELFDTVTVADHEGVQMLPVRPDGLFTLEDSSRTSGGTKANFFLEADRSTENHARFRQKLRGYWHYIDQGLHARKFGIQYVRVLTVARNDQRAEQLCRLALALLPERYRKYFFFTSLQHFNLANPAPILEAVHFSPRNLDLRYRLVTRRIEAL